MGLNNKRNHAILFCFPLYLVLYCWKLMKRRKGFFFFLKVTSISLLDDTQTFWVYKRRLLMTAGSLLFYLKNCLGFIKLSKLYEVALSSFFFFSLSFSFFFVLTFEGHLFDWFFYRLLCCFRNKVPFFFYLIIVFLRHLENWRLFEWLTCAHMHPYAMWTA